MPQKNPQKPTKKPTKTHKSQNPQKPTKMPDPQILSKILWVADPSKNVNSGLETTDQPQRQKQRWFNKIFSGGNFE